jgi:hypothetical protein
VITIPVTGSSCALTGDGDFFFARIAELNLAIVVFSNP